MKWKTFFLRKLRHYYGKVIFSESLRSQKGQNKPKKHPKIQLITYIWKKNSQWLCARSIIMMHFLPKTHKLSLKLRILEGWRTSQSRTFQPQASTSDFSTTDFSTMNFSTPDFSTMNFWTMGLKCSRLKSLGLKSSGLKPLTL